MTYKEAEVKVHRLELLIALSNLEADAYDAKARDLQNKAAVARAHAANAREQIGDIWKDVDNFDS